ncbi:centrosomal protein of 72 kDa isoform X2 [Phacochoerus africanus]|uniref:centrosomal protein of 72 kDa isoform X2 n=1 Tax=Phacochoerus africanus TaxID=41426 RepID=UPI001FD98564|nr:centrosomal protein of 72 kDa isoform X2 [Phacochoerus africanus]
MAPAARLVLCEEKIREKSGLAPHCDLAELQSLSIPGTYQEKITHLGSSFMNLMSLKSLDLSRNSLVSLEGIEYLTALESLNLYCNRISSLAEVFRLRSLAALWDVDLRLNPVVKSEADYRLFVVHMLPGLRQLDDRPVRERERTASRLRFALEESPDSKQSFPAVFGVERRCPSRAKGPDPSATKCLVMDADDEAVLNLIAECEWDLSNPPGSTSSSQREPEASIQSSHGSQHVSSPHLVQQQCGDSLRKGPEKRRSPLPRAGGAGPRLRDLRPPRCLPASPEATDSEDSASSSQKSSLSTQKALDPLPAPEKFRKRRMPGGSFQTPADQESLSCLGEGLGRRNGSGGWSQGTVSHSAALAPEPQRPLSESEVCPRLPLAVAPGKRPALEGLLLEALLDLVDRYWSGCRSLHGNELFLAQARHILSSLQEVTAAQDSSTTVSEEIGYLTLENKSLHSHLGELQRQCGAKLSEVVLELGSTRKEMDYLRQRLDRSLDESSSLKSLLCSVKKDVRGAEAPAALTAQITGLQTSVKRLSGEIVELKQHLEHYDKLQELTQMLQESHRSLVSTNERLLQELGQARAQHQAEVEQLHWSYHELKKTMALCPGRPGPGPGPGGC